MRVLSVNESPSIEAEANRLCALAASARDTLIELKAGQNVSLEGFTFRCLDAEKNVIIKITDTECWYLKYSRRTDWLMREIAGAEALANCIGDAPWYQHPPAIRASLEHRYTLYGRVAGKSFNATVLRACIDPGLHVRDEALVALRNLGRSFGCFHNYDGPDLPALNPTTISYVERYLAQLDGTNPLSNIMAETLDICRKYPGGGGGWIHSNAKSEDIFIDENRVSIIDFGTCGRGAIYEDLCYLCAYLVLLRTIPCFPWRFSRELLAAFLAGYAEVGTLEARSLNLQVTLAVYRYYLKNAGIESRFPRLSGFPVLKSRLERLVRELTDGSIVAMD